MGEVDFIREGTFALNDLRELFSSGDLVEIGLYQTVDAAYLARKQGYIPDYMKVGRRVIYPRKSVINFTEKHIRDGKKGSLLSTLYLQQRITLKKIDKRFRLVTEMQSGRTAPHQRDS